MTQVHQSELHAWPGVMHVPVREATAYCRGCDQNVIRGRPGQRFECATGGPVVLEPPNHQARNA